MKKLIAVILIIALALPAVALGDVRAWMYDATWTCTNYTTDGGVTIITLCIMENGPAFYNVQVFSPDKPGFGRAFVGTWEITGPDTIHVTIGENTSLDMCYSTYNLLYDTVTKDMYFRSVMRDGDVFP